MPCFCDGLRPIQDVFPVFILLELEMGHHCVQATKMIDAWRQMVKQVDTRPYLECQHELQCTSYSHAPSFSSPACFQWYLPLNPPQFSFSCSLSFWDPCCHNTTQMCSIYITSVLLTPKPPICECCRRVEACTAALSLPV